MKNIEEIKREIAAQLPSLQEKFAVKEIGIFGSVLSGKQTPESDVDILVDFSKPIGLLNFVRLKNELSLLLGSPVDLVMKTALKPSIGRHILTEVIYV